MAGEKQKNCGESAEKKRGKKRGKEAGEKAGEKSGKGAGEARRKDAGNAEGARKKFG